MLIIDKHVNMTNKNRRRSSSSGISLVTFLWVLFLILKLTHVIDWAWYWVFSPIWISLGLAILFLLVIGFIVLLAISGLVRESSKMIVGIKSWFQKKDQEVQEDSNNDS